MKPPLKPRRTTEGGSTLNENVPQDRTRRQLLKLMGLGATIPAAKTLNADTGDWASSLSWASHFLNEKVELTLYRPQDLMELKLSFFGFQRSSDNKSLQKASSPNLLIVEWQPQSIAEQAYEEKGGSNGGADFDSVAGSSLGDKTSMGQDDLKFPAKSYISGPSRLVFEIPPSITSIPLKTKDLLDWGKFKPVVNNRAAAPNIPPVFQAKDNIPLYNNILISKDPVIDIKPVNQDKQPVNKEQPANKPILKMRTIKPVDTVRQVTVNRDMRRATKDELKVIEKRESPAEAVKPTDGLISMVQNFTFGRTPRPVDQNETAIEFPYRLFISPNQFSAWTHDWQLKLRDDEKGTELKTYALWHSRLTCKNCNDEKDLTDATKSLKTVRALWGVDINGDYTKKPARNSSFKTSLYNDDRHCIVHESSNWDLPKGFKPKPVQVHNLMLSVLGAWFDAEMLVKRKELEDAGIIGSLNLLKWKHIATLARDHYVEIVYAGNMLPFGHEASLVRITERKPQMNYAVNRQRYFIVVNEEEKKYNPYNPNTGNFKSFPFSTVKFITPVTPTIDPPKTFCTDLNDKQPDHQFVPRVGGKEFKFKMMAYDLEGNEIDFEMPLVFVTTDITFLPNGGYNIANIGKLNNCYNSKGIIENKISLRNQKMAMTRSETTGDTVFETQSVTFNAFATLDESPGFRPGCKEFEIFIGAVENLVGDRTAQRIKLVDDELNKPAGQRKNKAGIFAQLIDAPKIDFNGNADKTGGALSPNFSVTALSKSLGAIGGDPNRMKGFDFNPDQFFDDAAKLFGVIDLKKIIKAVNNATVNVNADSIQSPIPALKNIETKDAYITQYMWNSASLTGYDFGFVKFKPKSQAAGKVKVETKLYRYKDPSRQKALTVDSFIDDFAVEIADVAAIDFKRVGFSTGSDAKVDVNVEMAAQPLRFLGKLSFINDLQRFIPSDGFSDPPFLDVTTSGVRTGYSLALPDLQLGAFTLSHVVLGASISLPFDGSPLALRFNFCEKQQPFTLTVMGLGGGGFLALEFDMHGVRELEAALEFGAAVSINLGVASGAVSIMGGVYYKMTMDNGVKSYELEGYVRINGALSVLGLITASVEFMLSLVADMSGGKVSRVWGEASLKIKIELFMFSKTVTLKTQRQFAGAGADPTFTMMISEGEWEQYCNSFAA